MFEDEEDGTGAITGLMNVFVIFLMLFVVIATIVGVWQR